MSLCPFLLSVICLQREQDLALARSEGTGLFWHRSYSPWTIVPVKGFDREGWLLWLFLFTIGDFVIISCVSLYKPCRCTTWIKYKCKPPAVLQPEVWRSLWLLWSSVQSQRGCHCDFWRTHSQTWWQWHPLSHSSIWKKLCWGLFWKDMKLFFLGRVWFRPVR